MSKKGQEEITGFIAIVVIVAIVLLVFLVIMVRQNGGESYRDSSEVDSFLRGTLVYTTNCAINYEPDYSTLGELLRECHGGRLCKSGELACDVARETLSSLVNSSWQFGPDRPIKGFSFSAVYNSTTESQAVLTLSRGNCSKSVRGADEAVSDSPGKINARMVLCY